MSTSDDIEALWGLNDRLQARLMGISRDRHSDYQRRLPVPAAIGRMIEILLELPELMDTMVFFDLALAVHDALLADAEKGWCAAWELILLAYTEHLRND